MRTLTVTTASLAALIFAVPALAQQVPPDVQAKMDAMQAQIDAQQSQLNELKAQVAARYNAPNNAIPAAAKPSPAVAAAPAPTTTVAFKNGTPSIASSDGAFTIAFHGIIQADAATYSQDKDLPAAVTARDLNSGTNFRRARLGMNGKLFKDFDYTLVFDFGGAGAEDVGRIHEAWIQYSGYKNAKLRVGEFAPLAGLADAGSANASPFLERAASAEIARNVAGGDTRMGVAVWNAYDRWLYSVAITGNTVSSLNTAASGFNVVNNDEQLGVAARIAGTPYKSKNALIHVGLNYSAVINPADTGAASATRYPVQLRDRPELRVDGTRLVDTGAINADSAKATGIELGWQYKTVYLSSEAFQFDIKRLAPATGVTNPKFSGWYVEGGWVLSGETRKYNTQTAAFDGITPAHNFDPKGGHWGAFELVGRYSTIDLDYHDLSTVVADRVRGGQQDIATVGLNWQLNPAVRFVFQGQSVKIDRLNSAGAQIGQDYTAFAVRSQFNY
ncbi:porin [Asticcacaulis sp. 201]|uniref:porin n=1 Tax=Asticcacaulis sp. 201 TaxID=3028787 RepID=UPI002916BAF0|nr:porin [Asticcacaulis sp. 201]MDV6333131.1 porin [Asticcacaulis sp. 201]